VAVKADCEFGGMDQKFNNLAGRELMAQLGMEPQQVLLVPLIPGTDGGLKMGKSLGNTIDIIMPPNEMYGRVMSLTDSVMPLYFEVLTDLPMEEIREMKRAMESGTANPRDFKMLLARSIVGEFISPEAAREAEAHFVEVFQKREMPEDMPEHTLSQPAGIVDLLLATGLASSKSEARRLIDGGGVRLDGTKVAAHDQLVVPGAPQTLQVGRRKFARIVS
jgi:tyrosyl-tRNA synthetase